MRPEGMLLDWPVQPPVHPSSSGEAPTSMPFVRHGAGVRAPQSLPWRKPERGVAMALPVLALDQTIGDLS
jgi:hypothetical protein